MHVRRRRHHAPSPALQVLRARRALRPVRGERGRRPQQEVGPVVEAGPRLTRGREGRRPEAPAGPDADVKALYKGWAAGYNAYLRSGKLRDPACKGKPWVKPITVRDLLPERADRDDAVLVSPHLRPGRRPAADRRHGARRDPGPAGYRGAQPESRIAASPLGSNGVGLGSAGTKNGTGMVLANPHSPWRGTERFWMAHLTVPGRYDVMGGTLGGFPAIGIGFNANLAWTHTVSTSRRFVVFQLKLAPGDPTSYVVDGKPEKMATQTVTVGGRATPSTRRATACCSTSPGRLRVDHGHRLRAGRCRGRQHPRGQPVHRDGARAAWASCSTSSSATSASRPSTRSPPTAAVAPSTPTRARPPTLPGADRRLPPRRGRQLVFRAARVITLDGSRTACDLKDDPDAIAPRIFGPRSFPS